NETQLDIIQMKELTNGDIILTLPDTVLFRTGEAVLRPEARPFIQAISEVLIELDRRVRVEGHTDNVPISTVQFPSNWELSATRAVTVVRSLSELYGLPADHLTAVGHADSRPLADNLTPENRAKNRRVELVVQEPRPAPQSIEMAEPHTALERFAAPQDAVKREGRPPSDEVPPALLPPLPPIELAPSSGERTK
ncbi:MAG: OmpA family protein, partial [Nitrospirota bacterium]